MQVSASNDKFQIQLELPGFAPEDFSLKTKDDIIIVEAVHEAKNEDGSTDSRRFSKEFKMPGGVASEKLASTYSGAGILTVSAPRAIQAPEGAQVTYKLDFPLMLYFTPAYIMLRESIQYKAKQTFTGQFCFNVTFFPAVGGSLHLGEMCHDL